MYFFLTFAYWYIPLQTRGKYQKKNEIFHSVSSAKKKSMPSNSSNLISQKGCAPLHKSPAGGMNEGQWYIAEVRTGMERVCRDKLLQKGYTAYVASRMEERVYACRNRRKVEHILIPSKLFVRITDSDRIPVLQLCSPAIYKFMTDKACTPKDNGTRNYAIVPDIQMQQMQFMLGHADKPVTFATSILNEGDPIHVVRGPLAGLDGFFIKQSSNTYVAVRINLIGYTVTEMPEADIIPIARS